MGFTLGTSGGCMGSLFLYVATLGTIKVALISTNSPHGTIIVGP